VVWAAAGNSSDGVNATRILVDFVNNTWLFTTLTAIITVFIVVVAEYVKKPDNETVEIWDLNVGVELLLAAFAALPVSTAFRISKSLFADQSATSTSTTLIFGSALLVGIVVLIFLFARIEGRRRHRRNAAEPVGRFERVWCVFLPDAVGVFALGMVLLYMTTSGQLPAPK
jgi:hypothetical protein